MASPHRIAKLPGQARLRLGDAVRPVPPALRGRFTAPSTRVLSMKPSALLLLAALCAAASVAASAAELNACTLGAPEVIKLHTGLALSISKAGTPAGPGGSSSCVLTGKPLQSMDVQLWRGSSAASFFQPAMYKAKEYAGPGYKAFIAHKASGPAGRQVYSGSGGVLKGDTYLSVIFDARDQAVSEAQLKALLDHLAGQL